MDGFDGSIPELRHDGVVVHDFGDFVLVEDYLRVGSAWKCKNTGDELS